MAVQNEVSICDSSASTAIRNTPRSLCSSADHQRCSNLSATSSASFIASRASEVRSGQMQCFSLSCEMSWQAQNRTGCLKISYSVLDPRNTFRRVTGSAARPTTGIWLHSLANAQNCDAWRVQPNRTRCVPLQQDYAQSKRGSLRNLVRKLMRSYPSTP